MNKSTLETQTGLKALQVGYNYLLVEYVDDYLFKRILGIEGFYGRESKAWQNLFDQWWRNRKTQVFERDKYKCVICGDCRNIECDHIVNRSQGGDSSMENLQTLCRSCHEKKTNNRE